MNINMNVKAKVQGWRLSCSKCSNLKEIGIWVEGRDALHVSSDELEVMGDYYCENCGCNLFGVEVCIKVECR